MDRLTLQRPIIFFDLEATGTDPATDRIVELAAIKIWPDGRREEKCRRFNPTIPIPPGATAVHGITDEDVKDEPEFERVARGDRGIRAFFEGCDLAGFNIIKYDVPLLAAEMERAGETLDLTRVSLVDAFRIFVEHEPRDLAGAVAFYLEREHDGAHGAAADAQAALEVLEAQLARYEDLGATPDSLDGRNPDFVDVQGKLLWVDGQVTLDFGKHKGARLEQLARDEPSYVDWMLEKGVAPDVAGMLRRALAGASGGATSPSAGSQPSAEPSIAAETPDAVPVATAPPLDATSPETGSGDDGDE
ncbi:MAG: exonuclease domain-containing protein [Anaerolineae bacterium]|jgi:DNA polymerase-3 subunit epsilon